MSPSIFLTLLCLGIASAAPTTDHSLEAQANQWMAVPGIILDTITDIFSDIVKATIDDAVRKLFEGGTRSSRTAINALVGEIIEEFQAGDVWIPEPETQTGKSVATEIPSSVDSGEEGHGLL